MKNTTPVILGIDPATKCGIAILNAFDASLVWCDTYDLKKSSKARSCRLRDIITMLYHQHNIQAVGCEEVGGFMKGRAASVLYRLLGAVECATDTLGLPLVYLSPKELKQFATGKGNAPKEKVMVAVKEKYPAFDGDDNAADAVMIALYALEQLRS